MLKKIFLAAFMATLFIAQNVSAQDVWIYNDGDTDYYIMTETFYNETPPDGRGISFSISVKYVCDGNLIDTKKYSFGGYRPEFVEYSVDGAYMGKTFNAPENRPEQPASEILNYAKKNLGVKEISYK